MNTSAAIKRNILREKGNLANPGRRGIVDGKTVNTTVNATIRSLMTDNGE